MGFQFFREEGYARVRSQPPPSKRKSTGTKREKRGKLSASEITAEALRLPGATPHVAHPQPPRTLFGAPPDEVQLEVDQVLAMARDVQVPNGRGGTRRQRDDTPVLLGAVCSYPTPANDDDPLYREWRERSVEWLRKTFGDDRIIAIVEHTDEPHGHLHALVHNRGESVKQIHAGHRAAAAVAAEGGTKKAQSEAYKSAERIRQDSYHAEAASRAGLLRIGPARQRLTRDEYNARKQAAIAEASAVLEAQTFAARARAEAEDLLARAQKRGRELLDAARAKADAVEEQLRQAWDQLRGRERHVETRAAHAEALLNALEPPKQAEVLAEASAALPRPSKAPQGPLEASPTIVDLLRSPKTEEKAKDAKKL